MYIYIYIFHHGRYVHHLVRADVQAAVGDQLVIATAPHDAVSSLTAEPIELLPPRNTVN